MSKKLSIEQRNQLNDVNFLTKLHHDDKLSLRQISNKLSVSYSSVKASFTKLNIKKYRYIDQENNKREETSLKLFGKRNKNLKIQDDLIFKNINNPDWLKIQNNINKKSIPDLSKELNVSKDILKYNFKKYNIEILRYNDIALEKRVKTHQDKYGVSFALQHPKFKDKVTKTSYLKYKRKHHKQRHISEELLILLDSKEWLIEQHHTLKKSINLIAYECKVGDGLINRQLRKYDIEIIPYTNISVQEKEIIDYIKLIKEDIIIIQNDRNIISPLELDIYLPEYKLAIEFDGLYWHSYDRKESNSEVNKHLEKTMLCESNNIQLIHIFENEWENKKDIIKSIILNKLGFSHKIFARKCEVREIDLNSTQIFLNENHLQGYCYSSIRLGLFYQDELIAVQTFKKGFYTKNYEWELSRFVTKKNYQIVGGASKLFTYFIKKYTPSSIVTFADRRYSQGNLYKQLGFKLSNIIPPTYFYITPNMRLYHRTHFQKNKLSKRLEIFDSSLSETENMFNNGYRRIWDCGNIKFIWTYKI